MRAIKIKDKNKLVAYVYFYLDYDASIKDRKEFINYLVRDMRESKVVGFAGYKTKEGLKEDLYNLFLFGEKSVKKIPQFKLNKRKILKIIKEPIERCHKEIHSSATRIFIFPTFDPFAIKKLSGIKGFSIWRNTILLFVYKKETKKWEKSLKQLIYHGFNHSIVSELKKPPMRWSILETLIYEGFATNFEEYLSGNYPVYAKALSKKECKKWFLKIKKNINLKGKKAFKFYKELFYEGKKYPLWTGYSIGYQIIKDFRKKNPNLSWEKIIRLNPRKVLRESTF